MVSSREKNMIGIGLLVAAGVVVYFFALPEFSKIQASQNQQQQLDTQITGMNAQKAVLESELANLRMTGVKNANGAIGSTAVIRTVTPAEQDAAVKEILDNIIKQATGNGNKLIELKPDDSIEEATMNMEQVKNAAIGKLNSDPTLETFTDEEKRALATADPSSLTDEQKEGYNLAVEYVNKNPRPFEARYVIAFRGTFPSLEAFLDGVMHLDDVVELRDINLVNEAGADRSGTDPAIQEESALFDPAKPIRLTSNISIYLNVR